MVEIIIMLSDHELSKLNTQALLTLIENKQLFPLFNPSTGEVTWIFEEDNGHPHIIPKDVPWSEVVAYQIVKGE